MTHLAAIGAALVHVLALVVAVDDEARLAGALVAARFVGARLVRRARRTRARALVNVCGAETGGVGVRILCLMYQLNVWVSLMYDQVQNLEDLESLSNWKPRDER